MPLVENFLANFRAAMAAKGMSIADVAEESGIHRVQISRILNEHAEPSVPTCERLARAVGLRPDTVFLEPEKISADTP